MATKFDLKLFFINHSEKIIGGIAVLLAMWCFAQTSWEYADVMPAKLIQQASDVRREIDLKNVWPEDEQKKFTENMPNIRSLASELGKREGIDHTRFSMPVVWNEPLMAMREKREDIQVLAPTHPEVSSVDIPLAFPPDEEDSDEFPADNRKDTGDEKKEIDSTRLLAAQQFGGNADAATPKDVQRPGAPVSDPRESQVADMMERFGVARADAEALVYGANSQDVLSASARRKVEWRAGISVRMIIDLQEQRRRVMDALHVTGNYDEIQRYVDYQQMHIERMQHRDGEWSGWEEVRLEDVGEILSDSLGQDIDIVSPVVTNPELTMPLPRRATGTWQDNEAAHSMITDFELSPEEQEMQNRIDEILADEARKAEQIAPPQRKRKKGFLPSYRSREHLGIQARNNYATPGEFQAGAMEQMQQFYNRSGQTFDDTSQALFKKQFEATATADYRLFLVRFIDFTAQRGFAYRYRVRLEMYNPNFEQIADDLVSPESAEQETIMSEWSEATEPVHVPMRYRNYARKVKATRNGQHSVDFGVYYEDDGVLPVMGSLSVDVGMPVAGHERTERVDLEQQVLEGGEVEFATGELLCGVLPRVRLNPRDHEDLQGILRKLGRQQPVAPLVSLVDARGDIVLRYAVENSHWTDRELVDAIIMNFASWRPEASGGRDGLDLLDDDDDEEEEEDSGYAAGRGRGRGLGMREGSALGSRSGRPRRRNTGNRSR